VPERPDRIEERQGGEGIRRRVAGVNGFGVVRLEMGGERLHS